MRKEERGPCMARAHRLGTPWCSAKRTCERAVKPFGSTVKKKVELRSKVGKKFGDM